MIILNDFKYALRLLAKSPGFTLLTTLVMAAGIGLSVYLFSFINSMIFKDLPFETGNRLIQVSLQTNGVTEGKELNFQDLLEIKQQVKGLEGLAAYQSRSANITSELGSQRFSAIFAEPGFIESTLVAPIAGRLFTQNENVTGAEPVVIIGYHVWQNVFSGQSALNQTLKINGVNHRVIGVMPDDFYFPHVAELWLPLKPKLNVPHHQAINVNGVALVKNGHDLDEVNTQISTIMQRQALTFPETNKGHSAIAQPIPKRIVEDGMNVVYAMKIAAVLILVLAAINVGNLLLSRALERSKETAIRMALGAPRGRLISQMLWESIIICTLGGLIGLLILAWGLEVTEKVTHAFSLGRQIFWFKFGLDSYTLSLFFSFLLLTIFITGFLPAWRNSAADFNAVLRDGTRGAVGRKSGRLNKALVISEIFLSMTILTVTGVILVSNYLEQQAKNAVDNSQLLTARLQMSAEHYDTPQQKIEFMTKLNNALVDNKSIQHISFSSEMPGFETTTPTIAIEGRNYASQGEHNFPRANHVTMSIGALKNLEARLIQGRFFNISDNGLDKKTVIISDSFAQLHFANESPLGKRLRIAEFDGDSPEWLTVVGVVQHISYGQPTSAKGKVATVFRPYEQRPIPLVIVALKMLDSKEVVTQALRQSLLFIDPELPAFYIETQEARLYRFRGPTRFITNVFTLFGLAAVILAASGIYGVMSNTVRQQTQEIGIKRALGADEERIIKEFLMSGWRQLLAGAVPGAFAGGALGLLMSNVMGATESMVIGITITLFVIVSIVVTFATWLPTRQALAMEPTESLRYQ